MSAAPVPPLGPLEVQGRTHAILCTSGFLIFLPIGSLVARYARTYTPKLQMASAKNWAFIMSGVLAFAKQALLGMIPWFYVHWIIQFLIAAPLIFAGWALGYNVGTQLGLEHFFDTHGKTGLALLILYLIQITLGAVVHFFKFPAVFRGHRAPHNYLHITIGIAIFILAAFQVHYGLYTEWPTITGNVHPVPQSAKNAWMALIIIFWVLFVLGLAFLPRQLKQEKERRKQMHGKGSSDSVGMVQKSGTA